MLHELPQNCLNFGISINVVNSNGTRDNFGCHIDRFEPHLTTLGYCIAVAQKFVSKRYMKHKMVKKS